MEAGLTASGRCVGIEVWRESLMMLRECKASPCIALCSPGWKRAIWDVNGTLFSMQHPFACPPCRHSMHLVMFSMSVGAGLLPQSRLLHILIFTSFGASKNLRDSTPDCQPFRRPTTCWDRPLQTHRVEDLVLYMRLVPEPERLGFCQGERLGARGDQTRRSKRWNGWSFYANLNHLLHLKVSPNQGSLHKIQSAKGALWPCTREASCAHVVCSRLEAKHFYSPK